MDKIPAESGSTHTPNIGAIYEITVFDTEGKVKQVVKDEAKCFVRNFLRMMRYLFRNGFVLNCNNWVLPPPLYEDIRNLSGAIVQTSGRFLTGGSNPYPFSYAGAFVADGAAGDAGKGIVMGTDATPVTNDDYKLGAIIPHGTGAGQMSYDAVAFAPMSIAGNVLTIPISRMIANNTANPITFNEIGLYTVGGASMMILRDVISPAVVINPGEATLIAYRIVLNG